MKCYLAMIVVAAACSEAPAQLAPVAAKPLEAAVVSRVPLGERLALEAASRPAKAVRVEQLEAALAKRGVTLTRKRQVLASPIEASYCELATTDTGLALSLCEFGDSDAAERGLARSRTTFDAMMPGRTLDTQANTLLTVTQPASPEAERQRQLARTTFASLPASTR
jgi:hypothetical protein